MIHNTDLDEMIVSVIGSSINELDPLEYERLYATLSRMGHKDIEVTELDIINSMERELHITY